jgi:hypothetical protein
MKFLIIFFLLLLSAIRCICQEPAGINVLDSLNQKQGFWIESLNGKIAVGLYFNDKKVGNWVFYAGLNVKRISTYKNDTLSGLTYMFNPNGSLKMELTFEEGRLNGTANFFSLKGELLAKYTYIYDKISSIDYYVADKESPPRRHDYLPLLE